LDGGRRSQSSTIWDYLAVGDQASPGYNLLVALGHGGIGMAKSATFDARVRVQIGKGVMDKWDEKPFAPRTMHYSWKDPEGRTWVSPMDFTWSNFALAMQDPNITEVQVIDEKNVQVTITLDRK
jgi:hypothetical protein